MVDLKLVDVVFKARKHMQSCYYRRRVAVF